MTHLAIKTTILSIAITSSVIGVNAYAPIEENKVVKAQYNSSITALELSTQDKKDVLALEQLSYESKKEEPQTQAVVAKEETQIEVKQAVVQPSTVAQRSFRMNNGSYKTGQELLDYGHSNGNAQKLWEAFNKKYGAEIADTALITLFYENGTFLETTTGVCNAKYQINGDYRNCVYADMNSAGMDAGLKQINTFYQRYRIAKLGGPSCEPNNSRDITDPCTYSQVQWLLSVDNNIQIALDIYNEQQNFCAWYGYKKGFNGDGC